MPRSTQSNSAQATLSARPGGFPGFPRGPSATLGSGPPGGPRASRRNSRDGGSSRARLGRQGRWLRGGLCGGGFVSARPGAGRRTGALEGWQERETRKGNAGAGSTKGILLGVTGGLGPCTPAAGVRAASEAGPRAAREGEGLRLPAGGVAIQQPLRDHGAALPRPLRGVEASQQVVCGTSCSQRAPSPWPRRPLPCALRATHRSGEESAIRARARAARRGRQAGPGGGGAVLGRGPEPGDTEEARAAAGAPGAAGGAGGGSRAAARRALSAHHRLRWSGYRATAAGGGGRRGGGEEARGGEEGREGGERGEKGR